MTPRRKAADPLSQALANVDWNKHVAEMDPAVGQEIAERVTRLARWASQLELADRGNPALCFVRGMQLEAFHVAALVPLGLYKPAAAAMRAMVESALYYTFFRLHPAELSTLLRDPDYYLLKSNIVEYHQRHTPDFGKKQAALGLLTALSPWYSAISAVVHGQVPGQWVAYRSLSEIRPEPDLRKLALDSFKDAEEIVHHLFLCTVAELWGDFQPDAKKLLLRDLGRDAKKALQLELI